MISLDTSRGHLDFLLAVDRFDVAILSYYDRSLTTIKSMGAALNYSQDSISVIGKGEQIFRRYSVADSEFDTYIQPIIIGKEKFYHAISINKKVNDKILLIMEGTKEEDYYNYLMKEFDLPLMKEWASSLFRASIKNGNLEKGAGSPFPSLIKGLNSITQSLPVGDSLINKGSVPLEELGIYRVSISAHDLEDMVKLLFKQGEICISSKQQDKLKFDNMDSYFKMYGHTLVENLEKTIVPLIGISSDVDDFTLNKMRLYPQQITQANGHLTLLQFSKYGILNHGMGTGKTVLGGSICEGYFVRKYLRSNPCKNLKDVYLNSDTIKYRNIIMCPGHLVCKWAEEIRSEVPYSDVTIISEFTQLLELRKRGAKRTHREFYVISKDFGKLSYQSRPSVSKRRVGYIFKKECADCGEVYYTAGHTCPKCKSRKYILKKTSHRGIGMVCPHCNKILLPNKVAKLSDELNSYDATNPLDHVDFTVRTEANTKCYYCEKDLWEPYVANIGVAKMHNKWNRATHYRNKARKGTKTVWVHEKYQDEYFESIGEEPINYIDTDVRRGSRKYSPVLFIKKYLKGFFDIAVFDEAHSYKGGSTGQGHAMHALIKSSKKQLALTGTIAGGYANHLFYLLYRLDPRRMRDKGFEYKDELKFAEMYGRIERTFDYCDDEDSDVYNVSCKGRQKSSPKVKPGISPLIFMDFLLDKTTFLDLSDMSKYLPPFIEKVELVNIGNDVDTEVRMKSHYQSVLMGLKKTIREPNGGKGILSSMLQFSLSYLDKPFGVSPIRSPKTGVIIVKPSSFDEFKRIENKDNLLSKEKRLVEIVSKEIEEGRNCFVYAEYTSNPETCITHRLKAILEKHCNLEGKVSILESSSPSAAKREAWIHKKAVDGVKVFITNPRCTETGLDFCFKENGVSYNYPTIIFYQMGYSLFTIWQASRRSYRLNQRKECRVYYLAVAGTVQEAVIQLIAEKQAATSAIQGKFSTEGLSAMAQGVDVKLKLAQAMSNMDKISGNNLQDMFDVLNQNESSNSIYNNFRPMLILTELLDDAKSLDSISEELCEGLDIFDLLEVFNFNQVVEDVIKDKEESGYFDVIDSVFGDTVGKYIPSNEVKNPAKNTKNKYLDGQIDMFSCVR